LLCLFVNLDVILLNQRPYSRLEHNGTGIPTRLLTHL
jgi:hypothetical protein